MIVYQVTEQTYEAPTRHHEYDDLKTAKQHVDAFYKNSDDPADVCYIEAIQGSEDIEYASPWADSRFKRLMGLEKEQIIKEYLAYKDKTILLEDHDYRTHHHDWLKACEIAKATAQIVDNNVDVSYWQHQIKTLNEIEAELSCRAGDVKK